MHNLCTTHMHASLPGVTRWVDDPPYGQMAGRAASSGPAAGCRVPVSISRGRKGGSWIAGLWVGAVVEVARVLGDGGGGEEQEAGAEHGGMASDSALEELLEAAVHALVEDADDLDGCVGNRKR